MSTKYIPQLNNENFVYPNYDLAEYDVNIIQDLNENSVTGAVTNFVFVSGTTSGLTFQYSANWSLNNATPMYNQSRSSILAWSIHCMPAGYNYFKPWRTISFLSTSIGNTTTSVTNQNFNVSAQRAGVPSFTSGTYYFEFRFIGEKAIFPVCQTLSITI
jgi:hypothetical protein